MGTNRPVKMGFFLTILLITALVSSCTTPQASDPGQAETQEVSTGEAVGTSISEAPPTGEPPTLAPTETLAATAASPETSEPAATPSQTSVFEETGPTPTGLPEGEVLEPGNVPDVEAVSGIRLDEVRLFTWTPDSQNLVVATQNDIVIYGLNPLEETGRFSAPAATLIEMSPSGDLLAWTGEDGTGHIWDLAAGSEAFTLDGRTSAANSLEFSRDGALLAISTPDNQIELWDTASGQQVQTWKLSYWVNGLSFSPDGKLLAGVELENFTVHIFNVPDGTEQRSLSWTEHASPALYGAAFTSDWSTLAWWSRGTVQLMDAATGALGPMLGHEDFISAVSISPESNLLASAAAGTVGEVFVPAVYLWDIVSGDQIIALPQDQAITGLEFSPDGRTLAVLTFDNILRLWEVPENSPR